MSVQTPLPKDHPAMKAWEAFKSDTEQYENTRKWARVPWNCFLNGYQSGQADLDAAVQQATLAGCTRMFDQFWDAAAAMGVPSGKYTPAELVAAIGEERERALVDAVNQALHDLPILDRHQGSQRCQRAMLMLSDALAAHTQRRES